MVHHRCIPYRSSRPAPALPTPDSSDSSDLDEVSDDSDLFEFSPPPSPASSASPIPPPKRVDDVPPEAPAPITRRQGLPLPSELISNIVLNLHDQHQYATLANMAQANTTFYNLVIPKLYETIIIDETNMLELGHGYEQLNPAVPEPELMITEMSGLEGDRVGPEVLISLEPQWTATSDLLNRPEEDSCYRSIVEQRCHRSSIDVALDNIADSLDRLYWPVSDRFTELQEIVYTRRALEQDPMFNQPMPNQSDALSLESSTTIDNSADSFFASSKVGRIVLHLQASPSCSVDLTLSLLSRWCHSHPAVCKSTHFVIYGVNFTGPHYNFYCMDVDIHFVSNGIPPGAYEHALAQWLCVLFIQPDMSAYPRLRLFDIPSRIFKDEDCPKDPEEAKRAARQVIEQLLDSKKRVGTRPKYLKAVMARIDFCDSGYVEEECPVSRA